MSDSVIKVAMICFTIICCFGFMTRAMIEMDSNAREAAKKNDDEQDMKGDVV